MKNKNKGAAAREGVAPHKVKKRKLPMTYPYGYMHGGHIENSYSPDLNSMIYNTGSRINKGNLVGDMEIQERIANSLDRNLPIQPAMSIMTPSGQRISRENFIKQYGEQAWLRATNQFQDGGEVPPGHHRMPDGSIMKDSEMPNEYNTKPNARAIYDHFRRNQVSPNQGTLKEIPVNPLSRESTLNYIRNTTDPKTWSMVSVNDAIVDGAGVLAPLQYGSLKKAKEVIKTPKATISKIPSKEEVVKTSEGLLQSAKVEDINRIYGMGRRQVQRAKPGVDIDTFGKIYDDIGDPLDFNLSPEDFKKQIAFIKERNRLYRSTDPLNSYFNSFDDIEKHYDFIARNKYIPQKNKRGGMIGYFAEGGIIPDNQVLINIEKNELLAAPNGDVIRAYKMQDSHAKNPKKEPEKNFVMAPQGSMIIPANMANVYEDGDRLRRKSINAFLKRRQKEEGRMKMGGVTATIPQVDSSGNPVGPPMDNGQFVSNTGVKSNNLSTANYLGAGTALASGVGSYTQPGLSDQQRADIAYNTGMGVVGSAGPYGAAISGISSAADAVAKPIKSFAERTDSEGMLKNKGQAQATYAVGSSLNPFKAGVTELSKKDPNWLNVGLGFSGLSGLRAGEYTRGLEKPANDIKKQRSIEENAILGNQVNQQLSSMDGQTIDTMNPYKQYKRGGRIPRYQTGTGYVDNLYDRSLYGERPFRFYEDPGVGGYDFMQDNDFSRMAQPSSGPLATQSAPSPYMYNGSLQGFTPPPTRNPWFNQARQQPGGIPSYQSTSPYTIENKVTNVDRSGYRHPQNETFFGRNRDAMLAGAGFGLNSVGPISDLIWSRKGYDKVNYGRINPNMVNSDEQLADIDRSIAGAKYNVRRTGSQSLLGAYQSLAAKRAGLRSGVMERTANTNADILNRTAGFNKQLEMQGLTDTAQNKARWEDIRRSAVRDIGRNAAYGIKDYQTSGTNELFMNLLNSRYGDYERYNEMIMSNPRLRRYNTQ